VTPVSPWSLLLLIILPALLLYPTLGFPLFEPDESRYAEIPREMLARGEWVVPYLMGEPYLDKPPLLYWLVMLSYRVFGVEVWAARLVPALAIHAAVIVAYLLGRRSLGERAAFRGALLLCLAPGFLGMGRLLLMDGLLVLCVTVGVLATFEAVRDKVLKRSWWLLAATACGFGVLTKGPVILILLVPPLVVYAWLTGKTARVSLRDGLLFTGVCAAVAMPWFVVLFLYKPEFAAHFFWEHNVMRFVSPFDHIRPIWFYGPVLLGGLLPGTLLAIAFIRFLLSGEEAAVARRPAELGFMLLAGGWCVFFFSLSGCKLPTYVLPAFPPLALALGWVVSGGGWERSRWPARIAVASYLLLLVGHNVALPGYAAYRSPLNRADLLAAHCNPSATVICYPRECNAVAFHLRRDDLRNYRSKEVEELRSALRDHPQTVVLLTHRHSLRGLRQLLPPEVCISADAHFGLARVPGLPPWLAKKVESLAGETALGLCDLAVVERRGQ
jgi:4-amino-4-deoxy-L-arabinose transferase-like glycosyltransferase